MTRVLTIVAPCFEVSRSQLPELSMMHLSPPSSQCSVHQLSLDSDLMHDSMHENSSLPAFPPPCKFPRASDADDRRTRPCLDAHPISGTHDPCKAAAVSKILQNRFVEGEFLRLEEYAEYIASHQVSEIWDRVFEIVMEEE